MGGRTKGETWRAWQADDAVPPAAALTRQELLAALARMYDVTLTTARLRDWQSVGALPHPVRQLHQGTVQGVYPPWYIDLAYYAVSLHAAGVKKVADLGPLTRLAARKLSRLTVSPEQAAHRASLGLPASAPLWLWDPFSPAPPDERPPAEVAAIEEAVRAIARPHLAAGITPSRVRIVIENRQGEDIEYAYQVAVGTLPTATCAGEERRSCRPTAT